MNNEECNGQDPFSLFIFAINSPETKKKYLTRLKKFFELIDLRETTIEACCKLFVQNSRVEPNSNYAMNNVIRFLIF